MRQRQFEMTAHSHLVYGVPEGFCVIRVTGMWSLTIQGRCFPLLDLPGQLHLVLPVELPHVPFPLQDDCTRFQQFPPGHYYDSKTGEFVRYYNPKFYLDFDAEPHRYPSTPLDLVALRTAFEKSVIKRLMSDVPFGECS